MPFDEELAARIRRSIAQRDGFVEQRMFGGVGFLLHGNMCVGVWKDSLIARVGPDAYDDGLREEHAREFDITGRPMKGWLMVEPEGIETDADLRAWLDRAIRFVAALPAKEVKRSRPSGKKKPPRKS